MEKRSIVWSPEARSDVRAIDRESALRILHAVDDYVNSGVGDIKKLRPPREEFRLRVGDYRILFLPKQESGIEILRVLHRREAYR